MTITFGPSTEQRQCRQVQILADELPEETESLRVTLSHGSGVLLNHSQTHTVVHIQDSSSGKRNSREICSRQCALGL